MKFNVFYQKDQKVLSETQTLSSVVNQDYNQTALCVLNIDKLVTNEVYVFIFSERHIWLCHILLIFSLFIKCVLFPFSVLTSPLKESF